MWLVSNSLFISTLKPHIRILEHYHAIIYIRYDTITILCMYIGSACTRTYRGKNVITKWCQNWLVRQWNWIEELTDPCRWTHEEMVGSRQSAYKGVRFWQLICDCFHFTSFGYQPSTVQDKITGLIWLPMNRKIN